MMRMASGTWETRPLIQLDVQHSFGQQILEPVVVLGFPPLLWYGWWTAGHWAAPLP